MIRFDPNTKKHSVSLEGMEFLIEQQAQDGVSKSIPFAISNTNLLVNLDPTQAQFRIFKLGGYTQTYQKIPNLENSWLLS